ncbi:hypothetical protein AMK11_22570 [Streptomyces sp. CB02414]|nr:hypothetical protein [Streptomyces sp. CB02414]OKI84482.1 hypothetical protein AMK11_22570 [Streptomyces sp. CB02414]
MSENTPGRAASTNSKGRNSTRYLLAGLGASAGLVVWAPRATFSIDGGFEAHARDLSVLFVDLPLILLGGLLVPPLTWSLVIRRVHRPWVAVLVALTALALGVWGLTEWWTPRQHPDPGYGPGI